MQRLQQNHYKLPHWHTIDWFYAFTLLWQFYVYWRINASIQYSVSLVSMISSHRSYQWFSSTFYSILPLLFYFSGPSPETPSGGSGGSSASTKSAGSGSGAVNSHAAPGNGPPATTPPPDGPPLPPDAGQGGLPPGKVKAFSLVPEKRSGH